MVSSEAEATDEEQAAEVMVEHAAAVKAAATEEQAAFNDSQSNQIFHINFIMEKHVENVSINQLTIVLLI